MLSGFKIGRTFLLFILYVYFSILFILGQSSNTLEVAINGQPYLELKRPNSIACELTTDIELNDHKFPLVWSTGVDGKIMLPYGSIITTSASGLSNGLIKYTSKLTFEPKLEQHNKIFICSAKIGVYTGSDVFQLQIFKQPVVAIEGESRVKAGEYNVWTCRTKDAMSIEPRIEWRYTSGKIANQTTSSSFEATENLGKKEILVWKTTSSINMTFDTNWSRVTLTCVAVQSINNTEIAQKQIKKNIDVFFPPVLSKREQSNVVYAYLGSQATILCVVERSSPSDYNISWTFNGNRIQPSDKRYEFHSSMIVILFTSLTDQGDYVCSVSNSCGTSYFLQPTRLQIQHSPVYNYTQIIFIGVTGGSLALPCDVLASPKVTSVQWFRYRNGKVDRISYLADTRYTPPALYKDPPVYDLGLTSLSKNDENDVYYCETENSLGKSKGQNLRIRIEEPKIDSRVLTVMIAVILGTCCLALVVVLVIWRKGRNKEIEKHQNRKLRKINSVHKNVDESGSKNKKFDEQNKPKTLEQPHDIQPTTLSLSPFKDNGSNIIQITRL